MKTNSIWLEIKNLLINKFNVDKEFDFNTLLTDIGIDSIKSFELVLAIEEHYGFEFEDESLSYQTLRNINSISEYVIDRIKEKAL